MQNKFVAIILSAVLAEACWGGVKDVDEKTAKQWLNYTLPLPHEISIRKEANVAPGDIGIKLPETAGVIEKNAAAQLAQYLKEKTGTEPTGNKYEFVAGVLDQDGKVCGIPVEDAAKLKGVPNNNQAYLIQPVGENKLVLAALNPKGVYYAVQTLRQLLGRQISKDSVAVPLATITDWPDMDERGFWNVGYAAPGFIPWLASLKLNFTSYGTGIVLKKDEKAQCPKLPIELINQARDHAFLLMPHLAHYDFFFRFGADAVYPELAGKGDEARNPWNAKARNPCMATPLIKRLVTEWIESAAGQGLREFSLWLSECTAQCECNACLKDGCKQMFKETQAGIEAIEAARIKYPDLQGRIFFTMNYGDVVKDSSDCLAILPPDIKVEKVYSRNRIFDKFAADGHWVVSYSGAPLGPGYFSIRYMADEIIKGLKEYHAVKYSGLFSRGRGNTSNQWEKGFCNYQFSAVAEWSWNAKGRDVCQFAEAWATLNNFAHPEQFAEWIEIVRPVESLAQYWEGRPTSEWLEFAVVSDNGQSNRVWKTKLPESEKIQSMLSKCKQALPVAEKVADQSVLLENRYLTTFLQIMKQSRDLCRHSADKNISAPEKAGKIQEDIKNINTSIQELGQLRAGLTAIPVVEGGGCKQIKARHDAWARELNEKIK